MGRFFDLSTHNMNEDVWNEEEKGSEVLKKTKNTEMFITIFFFQSPPY